MYHSGFGHWNHRIVKRKEKGLDGKDEWFYGIHEVYYDENDKPYMLTKEPIDITGETEEDLKLGYKQMERAFDLPVLDYDDDFPDLVESDNSNP